MNKLKAAVIGTGFIGPAHVEALKRISGVDLQVIASNEPERAREIADHFGIPRVYDDWHKVIADNEVEIVHNCTPNNLHFEINKAALLAGKHVVSEKPLTLNSEESSELVQLANEKQLVTAINYNYRFYPLIQHARSMFNSGEMGDVYLVHGNYLQDWLYFDTDYNWRLESGVSGISRAVADIGSHWCDLIQFITGQKITKVMANLSTIHSKRKKPTEAVDTFKGKETQASAKYEEVEIDTEDTGTVLIELENSATGVLTVSQVSAGRKNQLWFEIDAGKKALSWNQEDPNHLWVGYREKANEVIIKDPSLMDSSARRYAHYPGGHPEGYPDGPKNMFMNIYDYILSGKKPGNDICDFPTFADGHWENKITEAVLESNKKQAWVKLEK